MKVRYSLWMHASDDATGKISSRELEYPAAYMEDWQAEDIFKATQSYMERSLEAYLDGDDDGNGLMVD